MEHFTHLPSTPVENFEQIDASRQPRGENHRKLMPNTINNNVVHDGSSRKTRANAQSSSKAAAVDSKAIGDRTTTSSTSTTSNVQMSEREGDSDDGDVDENETIDFSHDEL